MYEYPDINNDLALDMIFKFLSPKFLLCYFSDYDGTSIITRYAARTWILMHTST